MASWPYFGFPAPLIEPADQVGDGPGRGRYGYRDAEQAGIRLADRPGPLHQLLVLATPLSARISADIAVAAIRFVIWTRGDRVRAAAGRGE